MDSIFYAVSIGFVLAGLILMFQKENFTKQKPTIRESITKSISQSKEGLKFTWNNRNLRYLTLSTLFLSLSAISWVAWEPLFLQNKIEIHYFPLIITAAFLFSSFGAYVSKNLVSYFKDEKKYLIATTFLMSISHILVFIILGPVAAIAFFVLKNVFYSFRFPIKQDLLHRFIPTKLRATIGSVDSMYDAFSVAIATIFGGLFMDFAGVNNTVLITGLLMLPSVFFSVMISIKEDKKHILEIEPEEVKMTKITK